MEDGVHNSGRIIQTNSNTLWLDKLTCDTLDNDKKVQNLIDTKEVVKKLVENN